MLTKAGWLITITLLFLPTFLFIRDVGAAPTPPKWIYDKGGKISDPVNVVFYGYGRAFQIEALLIVAADWDPILVCGDPAYLDGALTDKFDRQVEYPADYSCLIGERYHLRIWDMGWDPEWGYWAVGGVHVEHVDITCACHKISNDGWERAERKLKTDFAYDPPGPGIPAAESVGEIWIDNSVTLQEQQNNGYAAFIKIRSPRPWLSGTSPYVSTWDGTTYVTENNLMPFSEGTGGIEAFDYYRIQGPMTETAQGYKLLLTETGAEHSFFDRVRLLAADYPADARVAVSLYGQLHTYKNPRPAILAVDDTGVDQTNVLAQPDGVFYEGSSGSHVTLNFEASSTPFGERLLIRADPIDCRLCKLSIYIQVRDSAGAWQNVTFVVPRVLWYTESVDLTNFLPDPLGQFEVRLFFSTNHRVDYVALDTSEPQPITVTEGSLLTAVHSTQGDVTLSLRDSDNVYSDIVFGDQIELTFQVGSATGGVREFVLISEGYVVTES